MPAVVVLDDLSKDGLALLDAAEGITYEVRTKLKGDELRDKLPGFSLTPTGLQESIKDSLLDILILFVLNVLFFMLAFLFFLRYDVR